TTPTSFWSRFSARPVIPWPRSIISFSIASVRPSIRATPSPISRMTPTFCLAVVAFTPAISASISIKRSAIYFPHLRTAKIQSVFHSGQPGPHTIVINITAGFDPHAADQRGALRERDPDPGTVDALETSLNSVLQLRRQGRSAFNSGTVLGNVEL